MQHKEKYWAIVVVAVTVVLLWGCAHIVKTTDPYFQYHAPDPEGEVWFDARGQSAGLLRTQEYETLFMGSSLAANYRPFWFDVFYETSTVKVAFPNGGFGEFDQALKYAYTRQDLERVIFGLDPNLLARDPKEEPAELLDGLYDDSVLNNLPYLLNKDVLMRSFYVMLKRSAGETQKLQDAFMWDGISEFNRAEALAGYERPEDVVPMLPADTLLENCRANLSVVTGWVEQHPDTEFIFFFSPYGILFWDKMERTGMTEAMLALLEEATETLLAYDNVEIQFFMDDFDVITDLELYADHLHIEGSATYAMAESMTSGKYRMTRENRAEVLDGLRQFVVNYDYESIFAS